MPWKNLAIEPVEILPVGVAHSRSLRMPDLSRTAEAEHFVKNTKCAAPTN